MDQLRGLVTQARARFDALTRPVKLATLGGAALISLCLVCVMCSLGVNAIAGPPKTTAHATATTPLGPTVTQAPTSVAPTATPRVVHYPPTTNADLLGLSAMGDAGKVHEVHSESVGLGVCPQPKREVLVDPSMTGQQLAEDLLAYFYSQRLTSPCGSLVGAYHSQSEMGDSYTAGRILFEVTTSNGQPNVDPNATNLRYTLTLDLGDALSSPQQYVVTY